VACLLPHRDGRRGEIRIGGVADSNGDVSRKAFALPVVRGTISAAYGASFSRSAYTPPYRHTESQPMTTRRATCSCGQLHLTIEGEPSRISICHCLECQRRTGAVISNQARFRREQVTFAGEAKEWRRTAESGNLLTFHFCPTCGSTVSAHRTKGLPVVFSGGITQPAGDAISFGFIGISEIARSLP